MPAKRIDPEDGVAYTYDELAAFYKGKYKKKVIDEYWESTCYTSKQAKAKAKEKASPKGKPKAKEKAKAKAKVKAKAAKPKKEAPPVKLHYFPLKARCFPPLLALEVGKINYEAVVVPFDEWPDKKASGIFPMGYLPALELADGTMINETGAMLFTIGKIARLNGGSTTDFGTSAMLACKALEVFTEFTKVCPTMFTVKEWTADKTKAFEESIPKLTGYLEAFAKLCSDEGKFTKQGNTTGELALFSLLYHMKAGAFSGTIPEKLDKFYGRLEALDAVKMCCENKTKMGDLADYVVKLP
jgi:hypothetical protein|mmetsp:Transcript_48195/g.76185  ORF Transcript_48195/g.76185 Transcript_48195/m.76185 type:complete len:299 (-) Transcript_48195:107-1003(-)